MMSNRSKAIAVALSIMVVLSSTGCTKSSIENAIDDATGSTSSEQSSDASAKSGPAVVDATAIPDDTSCTYTEWSESAYPSYVRIVSEPVTIDHEVKDGVVENSPFDSLGRSRRAVARITAKTVSDSASWRADFASDVDSKLSGWGHNGKSSITVQFADGKHYKGYFWNRSHLVADSLGGYEADGTTHAENLVTGTREQNVGENKGGGMQYFESLVTDYVKANPDASVWYSVQPIYEGDELVPRSVWVKVLSSDGGLDVQGEVFNAAPGYTIDYATGEFSAE